MRGTEEARAGANFPEAAPALMGINQPFSHLPPAMPKWASLVSSQEEEQLDDVRCVFVFFCWLVCFFHNGLFLITKISVWSHVDSSL